jgi:penicillin amidase
MQSSPRSETSASGCRTPRLRGFHCRLGRLVLRLVLGRRLARTRGRIEVEGIGAKIDVRRDRWGVPHIRAGSDADAWFGLGFCHGQDRAFQLEMIQRAARGTLAEIVGRDAVAMDRLSRRIGFYRAAESRLRAQDEAYRDLAAAYAAGVNAGRTRGLRRRPHELALLRAEFTPYAPADALAMLSLLSFLLTSNWEMELVRLRVLDADGAEALRALAPAYPEWLPVSAPFAARAAAAADRLADDIASLLKFLVAAGASNNWALAPSRTRTGRPLLANDPHLTPVLPSPWYLVHIVTPEWAAAGATFVGAPGITVGHNGHAAWGVTAGLVDNTDLFVEEVGPDGRSLRGPHGYAPCEVRREVIRVRGAQDVVEEVLVGPRGPIISPAITGERFALSLRAVWLDPLPVGGSVFTQRARSFADLRTVYSSWPAMSLNLVYADASGKIGWQLAGDAPRRRKGWGTLPLAGWDPDAGWNDERVPFEAMPHLEDPECGFVASANNPPLRSGEGHFLGADFLDGYRMQRISEALDARSDWDVEDSLALQLDLVSLPWREMRDVVLGASLPPGYRGGECLLQAQDLLRSWDGKVSADSAAAAVFECFLAEMSVRVVRAKAPRSADWVLGRELTPLLPHGIACVRRVGHLARLLREKPTGWFEEPWGVVIGDALATAVAQLRVLRGRDPRRWAWGEINAVTFRHPFGHSRLLGQVFDRGPFPIGGDANTVAQAAVDPLAPASGALFVPSLRAVIDVGAWERSRFVLPGGQSGNPLSRHYDDQLPLWLAGEGIALAWSEDEVERETRHVLHLVPGSSTRRLS